jgi:hypothetical protein
VKFIILLHKVAYDYVTFFDVYQCAISPPLLEERIAEAEDITLGHHYVAITSQVHFRPKPAMLSVLSVKTKQNSK